MGPTDSDNLINFRLTLKCISWQPMFEDYLFISVTILRLSQKYLILFSIKDNVNFFQVSVYDVLFGVTTIVSFRSGASLLQLKATLKRFGK